MTRSILATLGFILSLVITSGSAATDVEEQRRQLSERLAAIQNNEPTQTVPDRLNAFIDLYFQYTMLEFPEFATFVGHPQGHDRWTDNSPEAVARREQDQADALALIQSIDRSQLTGVDRLNHDLLLERLESGVAGNRFGGEYLQISQLSGPQQALAQMMQIMPASNVGQYEDILARLRSADEVIEQDLHWLREGLKKGVTPPRITLRDVPEQIENQIFDDPMESPMLAKFTNLPDSIPESERERLQGAAIAAYQDEIVPALRKLHGFIVDEYLPGSREDIAMSALPDGEQWYAFNVRQQTTTELTPQEIHDIGLSEVKRIRTEMEKIREQVGFDGDLEAFFEHLRTDPKFFFTDEDELLQAYRDIAKRADPQLVKVFGHLPRTPYGVEPVPEYAEKSQTTAYYQRGSMEAGRPGTFFANTYALDTRPKWEMEALTLHEAVPGHHLQIAIQQELEDMAWFRRFGGYTAFVEGWGLYSESLGPEMGFYQDPYSKFGQLTYEMWRAIRLVVDTGMHSLGWSRQQAIDFFKANAGKSEHDIVVEIDRYIVWPGQALAYKIGELKLKELRARAEQKLGEDFDIRAFHDEVLGQGSLPLTVLERRIDEWIAAQQ